ncbi:MAG: biotin/lipoyl-binding protein [Clostridiales bacterium]|nr:biotin/lipoyl-binding protein [Clostridiales bacterium]
MKSYTITVNGNVYDVTVEETAGGQAFNPAPAPATTPRVAPVPTPVPSREPVSASSSSAGAIDIEAGAAGKVVDIVSAPGTAVSRGDTVLILEVMKMETPVVAPQDGTVASIEVTKGQQVAAGDILATMN